MIIALLVLTFIFCSVLAFASIGVKALILSRPYSW